MDRFGPSFTITVFKEGRNERSASGVGGGTKDQGKCGVGGEEVGGWQPNWGSCKVGLLLLLLGGGADFPDLEIFSSSGNGFHFPEFPHRAYFQTTQGSLLNHICFHGRNYNRKRLPYLCPCSWLDYGVLCALNAFQLLFEQILLKSQTTNFSWDYLRQGQLTVKGKLAWLVFNDI